MRSKYGAKKTTIDGIKFDSLKEGRRYKELKLLERAGKIFELELQPTFILQDKFKYNGKTHRAIKYIADFAYTDGKKEFIEDVKGMKTDVYKMKMKMFLHEYGDLYTFIET